MQLGSEQMDALPQTFSRWSDAHARAWVLAGPGAFPIEGIICGPGGFFQVRLAEYFIVERVKPGVVLGMLRARRVAAFRFDVRGIHERAAVARDILEGEGTHGSQ